MSVNTFMANLSAVYEPGAEGAAGTAVCAAMGAGILADKEVCISSTNRNFKGRMGANSAKIYLASPYTVAATAVAGRITDPREMLA